MVRDALKNVSNFQLPFNLYLDNKHIAQPCVKFIMAAITYGRLKYFNGFFYQQRVEYNLSRYFFHTTIPHDMNIIY